MNSGIPFHSAINIEAGNFSRDPNIAKNMNHIRKRKNVRMNLIQTTNNKKIYKQKTDKSVQNGS